MCQYAQTTIISSIFKISFLEYFYMVICKSDGMNILR
jgi:hypothetical protein